jgi:hypothetical protein
MNALEMKAEQAAYWRFKRQMPVVAVEALSEDVIVITRGRKLYIIEIKVSISDLRRDIDKSKHAAIRDRVGLPLFDYQKSRYGLVPNAFYFAVPFDIEDKAEKVIEELYPYAGLLVSSDRFNVPGHGTSVKKQAQDLKQEKLTLQKIAYYVKAQSASLANAYAHLARKEENGVLIHQ